MADNRNEDESTAIPDEPRRLPPWLVPALIGLVTISAGLVAWRAGQLGSSAAFEDRQSVGQTITQQKQVTEAGLGTASQASAWVSYSASIAQAAATRDLAAEAATQGRDDVAGDLLDQAANVVDAANELAVAQGVFGQQQLISNELNSGDEALREGFSIEERFETLKADAATGVTSPGVLDPDGWARKADETRSQVRMFRHATVFMLIAAAAYTVAELARRRSARMAGFVIGGAVYLVTLAVVVPSMF